MSRSQNAKCALCGSFRDDELMYGPSLRVGRMMVHKNCLYLSSGLVQRGDDTHGVLHFLQQDIIAETRRISTLMCCYCHCPGANIGCCKGNCRRTFHTGCGIEHKAQNQFFETYKSYCNYHVRGHKYRPAAEEDCVICFDRLFKTGEKFNFVTMLHSPCCHNGWYHRDCLQRYANSAGYFFKCPLCNNSTNFREVACWGISVPNCDASWETEPNAFREQSQRQVRCTAAQCQNPLGRDSAEIQLYYCILCGSNPVHIECTRFNMDTYSCGDCSAVSPVPPPTISDSESDFDPFESLYDTMIEQAINFRNAMAQNNSTLMNASINTTSTVLQKRRAPSADRSDEEDEQEEEKDEEEKIEEEEEEDKVEDKADEEDEEDDWVFNSLAKGKENKELNKPELNKPEETSTPPLRTRNRQTLASTTSTAAQSPQRGHRHTLAASTAGPSRRTTMPESGRRSRRSTRREVPAAEGRVLRSRSSTTTAAAASTHSDTADSSFDISCVANRTRQRLPRYLAANRQ